MDGPRDKSAGAGLPPAAPRRGRWPGWLANWLERHQHPVSFWLHLVGIPLTVAAVVLAGVQLAAWRWDLWYRPVVLLAAGYGLQWVGHWVEGNDMGEIILIKRWRGREYVAVAPRYQRPAAGSATGLSGPGSAAASDNNP